VSGAAVALALAAAIVHALWNVLVGGAREPRPAAAVAMLAGVCVAAPLAVATWDVETAAVPWIVASALLELAYVVLLAAAYERAAVAVVYPIARGAAPPLVLAAAVLTGASTDAGQLGGVALVVAGIALVRGSGVAGLGRRDLLLALSVAATIAGYTLVDKRGLEHASPVPYLEAVMVGPALAYTLFVARRMGAPAVRAAVGRGSLLAGACMFGAYALVLAALQRAPAAPVAAVRESSIVMAPLFAAVLLRNPIGRRGLLGAAAAAAGVAVVALA
jgi:drug/metabolite transporter (DMT)-like permease